MRRKLSWLLSCVMIALNLIPCIGFADISTIGINAYIQLGKYNDEPILWQCADIDEYGALMISDKGLCRKEFDGYGTLKGSHVRRYAELGIANCSNYWGDSNIRSWLNSKAPAGEVEWLCGNPPYSYANEKGFLADGNFTPEERSVMKVVTQKSLLDGVDADLAVGGSMALGTHGLTMNIRYAAENTYDDVYYEYVTDKVFLPDIKQYCKMDNKYVGVVRYWLRTPYGIRYQYSGRGDAYQRGRRLFTSDADYSVDYAYSTAEEADNRYEVRPAFYLNEDTAVIVSGEGTKEAPYILASRLEGDALQDNFDPADGYQKVPTISLFYNGTELELDQPSYYNWYVYVPLRAVFEALGAKVEWYENAKLIFVTTEENTCIIKPNCYAFIKNNQEFKYPGIPHMIDDITYATIELVGECLGATVEWVEGEQKVLITTKQ